MVLIGLFVQLEEYFFVHRKRKIKLGAMRHGLFFFFKKKMVGFIFFVCVPDLLFPRLWTSDQLAIISVHGSTQNATAEPRDNNDMR